MKLQDAVKYPIFYFHKWCSRRTLDDLSEEEKMWLNDQPVAIKKDIERRFKSS